MFSSFLELLFRLLASYQLFTDISHFFTVFQNLAHDPCETTTMSIIVVLEQINHFLMLEIDQTFLHKFEIKQLDTTEISLVNLMRKRHQCES